MNSFRLRGFNTTAQYFKTIIKHSNMSFIPIINLCSALVCFLPVVGGRLSSDPAVGCIYVGISLHHETFVNSSAPLMSLMALRLR